MKKSLLLIPVLALMLAGATSCGNTSNGENTTQNNTAQNESRPAVEGDIVYVRMDSLMTNYEMVKELGAAFEEKSGKAETDLTNRGRSLERELMSAQEKVQKGLVTRQQAQSLEEELGRKQQNFMNHRDKLLNELAEEEQVMMNRISNSIMQFLEDFNKDFRYKMIISTSGASPILHATPDLDITNEVLEGLNAYYKANKENL